MPINALITINGTEVTEHGRVFSDSVILNNNIVELANGNSKIFYKPTKKTFKFAWTYVPDKAAVTVDSRVGRDFLNSLMYPNGLVTLGIQYNAVDNWLYYTCMVSDYSESLIRNSLNTQCRYYNISLSLESIS